MHEWKLQKPAKIPALKVSWYCDMLPGMRK